MTEAQALRATPQRLHKSDHELDDGNPTKDQPYVRPQRLGTAWDRYSRDRDKDGRLLADEDMILTRRQVATGTAYINLYEGSMWGGVGCPKYEPSISSSFKGVPATQIDRAKELRRMEAMVRPQYLIPMIQLVLIDGLSAEEWAKRTGRHPKSGIWFLRTVLDMMGGE